MEMQELTLEKFEEASEAVQKVILPTNLIYSEYYSAQTGSSVRIGSLGYGNDLALAIGDCHTILNSQVTYE